jgi:hypothetical protein
MTPALRVLKRPSLSLRLVGKATGRKAGTSNITEGEDHPSTFILHPSLLLLRPLPRLLHRLVDLFLRPLHRFLAFLDLFT